MCSANLIGHDSRDAIKIHQSSSILPRALFIAYDFPPCKGVGGGLRSEKFVKYLPQFGWDFSVLCLAEDRGPEPEICENVIRVPSLTDWHRPYEVTPFGWLPTLWLMACKILRKTSHKLIYVTGPPFLHSIVATFLKHQFRLPLVVDFRDAWSLDPYMEGSRLKKILYRYVFPAVEKRVLLCSDAFIVNTPSALRAYTHRYPGISEKTAWIPNGYDEADFVGFRPSRSKKRMTFLYLGRFGIGNRNPLLLLRAFQTLIGKGLPLGLKLIGSHGTELKDLVKTMNLEKSVEIAQQVSHFEAINALANSDVLIVYQEQSRSAVTPVAGKTFEYLKAGKPILAIAPSGDNVNIISTYACRYEAVTTFDEAHIRRAMHALFLDWKENRFPPYMAPKHDYARHFNREALTECLVSIFNKLVQSN